jgi:excisionase family DNA binding protein
MKLWTVAETADALSVSTSLIYQLVEAGKIPCHRIGRGRGAIRFRAEDIAAYLQACRVGRAEPDANPKPARPKLKHVRI